MAMAMHRHFYAGDKVEQLLFRDWSPHSPATYALTLAAVLLLAVFHEWFCDLHRRSLAFLRHGPPPRNPNPPPPPPLPVSSSSIAIASISSSSSASSAAPSLLGLKRRLSEPFLFPLRHRRLRLLLVAIAYASRSAAAFLLMLAVMSFNVGVFLAALAGLAIGFLLFRVNHLSP
jgi:hypothetical protein